MTNAAQFNSDLLSPAPARPADHRAATTSAAVASVRIVDSLREFDDAALDAVTASASVFFDRGWFRMLDGLDLSALLGGAVRLRYAVAASDDGAPLAICPFLTTRSSTVRFSYSFDKAFFTGWQDELVRVSPEVERFVRWASWVVKGFRLLARGAGARTDGWVLAVSPLSFRGGMALRGLPPDAEARVRRAVLAKLQGVAADEALPLSLFLVPEEDLPLREAARAVGLEEMFLVYDTYIDLDAAGIDGYLARFRARPRDVFRREMKKVRRGGVRFEVSRDLSSVAPTLSTLYETTYTKYGAEHFAHPPAFWRSLERSLDRDVESIRAYRDDTLVGFSVLVGKRELFAYRMGKLLSEDDSSLYFNLAFYEPIRRAGERGARRLWLGPGALEAKRHRAAVAHSLYGYFWFPDRASRLLFLPYLRAFTQATRKQLEFARRPCTNLKAS
jgi:predicted N-acyltransferase